MNRHVPAPSSPIGAVLRSRRHRLLSGSFVLLRYRAASGEFRSVPVRYVRSGADLLYVRITDPRRETWWRALRPTAPVSLLLNGRETEARADVLDSSRDPRAAASALAAYRSKRRAASPAPHGGTVMVRLRLQERRAPAGSGGPTGRRVVVERYGGPEVLRVVEEPVPEPRFGQVRVRVLATEVNFTDILLREGVYPGGPQPPFTPGYDLVGVVDAVGPGVTGWEPGQRVAALTVHGGYADHACLPAGHLVPLPDDLDPVTAVSLVLSYVTAYQLLHRTPGVRRGSRVLVQGAAGAVGSAALQLGRLAGLRMYGTAAALHAAYVAALGATPVDHEREKVARRVRELSGGGVDLALDSIGGATAWRSYRALRPGGRLVLFGHYASLSQGHKSLPRTALFYLAGALVFAASLLPGGRRVRLYRIAALRDREPARFREDLGTLFGLLAKGEISPRIAEVLPLERAGYAQGRLVAHEVTGKQVLVCAPEHTG